MIKTIWLDHLKTQKERDQFKATVITYLNDPVFTKLKRIITSKLETLEDQQVNPETYANKDWSHMMAHQNGYKQALIELMTILTTNDRENT